MVELALVLVLLVMLLVGTVSAAVAFGRGNSIQNAAREASRFGATLPGAADAAWLNQVRGVARAAASGDLDTSVPGYLICVAFIDASNNATSLTDTGSSDTTSSMPCFTDNRPDEAKVQVYVERESDFQAIVFSRSITLSAEAAARYER
jgi:Flp pilus assembly protein TadG